MERRVRDGNLRREVCRHPRKALATRWWRYAFGRERMTAAADFIVAARRNQCSSVA